MDDVGRETAFRLGCSHALHNGCIINWFYRGGRNTCPLCRVGPRGNQQPAPAPENETGRLQVEGFLNMLREAGGVEL